jgi:pyruvate dehydrogenase complex dehydrogenase (E1) component
VSREHIAFAALRALADQGDLELTVAEQALSTLRINASKPNPMRV